jgi:methylthioribose-1-phosphate isomerase
MQLHTHLFTESRYSGKVTKLETGYAEVTLPTHRHMCADEKGLIHGGFIFSAADFAAMAAVNDPNVVLGAAHVKFLAPVKKGETVVCKARVTKQKGKKRNVYVEAFVQSRKVFEGDFTTFVLDTHVFEK